VFTFHLIVSIGITISDVSPFLQFSFPTGKSGFSQLLEINTFPEVLIEIGTIFESNFSTNEAVFQPILNLSQGNMLIIKLKKSASHRGRKE